MMAALRDLLAQASRQGRSILAAVAGTGQVTRCAVEGGADVLMALNAGLYRNLGTGSLAAFLPYGNANAQTLALLREHVLPQAGRTPVVAGVCASDPALDLPAYLGQLRDLGVEGVVNWPAVGFVDGQFRQALEAEGFSLEGEAAMLAAAKQQGLLGFGFALAEHEVARFLRAGVDAMVLNLGLTRRVDDVQQKRDLLQQAIARLNSMLQRVARERPGLPCLLFGGPITTPEDLEQVFRHSSVHGFAGGSVFERLPVQTIITTMVRQFKGVTAVRAGRDESHAMGEMVGRSPAIGRVYQLIRRVAPHDVNVCIEGETGTGKELVATQIHRLSYRANQPFITLNCGAIPDALLESELFGHEKGSFTGADRRRLGKFELAHRGTLFLDEVADLSLHGQVALLRAIQQREITRVGGEASIPIDVRILAASNQPLTQAVAAGRFREDLYYRLAGLTITVPPLRQRREDITLLVEDILRRLQAQMDRKLLGLAAGFQERLGRHHWPGNIRELEHVIRQAVLLEDGPVLEGHHFSPAAGRQPPGGGKPAIIDHRLDRAARRDRVRRALLEAGGNKSLAARRLGITRKTLYAWLDESD